MLKIVKQVEEIVKNNHENVILNVYGFSRGGAAAFWLAQKLKASFYLSLKINNCFI